MAAHLGRRLSDRAIAWIFITPTILRSPEDQEQSMRKLLEEKIRDYGAGLAAQREAIFGKDGK